MYITLFQKVLITKNFYFWITWGLLQLYSIPSLFQFSSIVLLLSTTIYDSAYFFFLSVHALKREAKFIQIKSKYHFFVVYVFISTWSKHAFRHCGWVDGLLIIDEVVGIWLLCFVFLWLMIQGKTGRFRSYLNNRTQPFYSGSLYRVFWPDKQAFIYTCGSFTTLQVYTFLFELWI